MKLPRLKLFKFLRLLKPKDWSQRVSFWPARYPHRIATWADVAAMQHIITTSGFLNTIAIDHLLRDEDFWQELSRFFQSKADELSETIGVAYPLARPSIAVRKVPLCCWDSEEKLEPSDFTSLPSSIAGTPKHV